ncbi:DUF4150 domain-containing protein [Alteromonadaceae bacterium M269]|nr:DUF4150 domain-containing protein [Alteromonadaceae bacterium M269]
MGKPIAPADNMAFAFPDICLTTIPPAGPVPIPYPNIAQLADAQDISDESNKELLVGGKHVLLQISSVGSSSGAEPADPSSGVTSGAQNGVCYFAQYSGSVLYGSQSAGIVRFMDATEQNAVAKDSPGNAKGMVLASNPSVLVGD